MAKPPRLSELRPGTNLDRFTLVRELGRGGFGLVFEAQDNRDAVRVAIKLVEVDLSSPESEAAHQRFQTEVAAVQKLRHPNVVQVYDALELRDGDRVLALYVMDVLSGVTLEQAVRTQGAWSVPQAVNVMRQVAAGLEHAHQRGIIHRDVKPANIFLTQEGKAVVMDFGVCKLKDGATVTRVGQLVGTPRYLAPEQLVDAPVDARTDVFALGLVMSFLLTGQHLRPARALKEVYASIMKGGDADTIMGHPTLPPAVKVVLGQALWLDPSGRHQTARDFSLALEGTAQEQPPPPVPRGDALVVVGPERTQPAPEGSAPDELPTARDGALGAVTSIPGRAVDSIPSLELDVLDQTHNPGTTLPPLASHDGLEPLDDSRPPLRGLHALGNPITLQPVEPSRDAPAAGGAARAVPSSLHSVPLLDAFNSAHLAQQGLEDRGLARQLGYCLNMLATLSAAFHAHLDQASFPFSAERLAGVIRHVARLAQDVDERLLQPAQLSPAQLEARLRALAHQPEALVDQMRHARAQHQVTVEAQQRLLVAVEALGAMHQQLGAVVATVGRVTPVALRHSLVGVLASLERALA